MMAVAKVFSATSGLNNVIEPHRLKYGEDGGCPLAEAVNVVVDDSGSVKRRYGIIERVAAPCHSLWASGEYCFFVSDGKLYRYFANGNTALVHDSCGDSQMFWCEFGGKVYCSNGTFRAVLKDSRIGTFGVLGLVLVVLGQVAAVSILILTPEWRGTLLVAPVFGRCAPIVLTFLAPPHPKAGLGSITCEAPRGACLLTAVAVATLLPFFCLPARYVPALLGVTVVLLGLALTFIARVARRENGLSGDFFGCAIIAGECSALLAACLLR